uniref:Mitochondrial carrier protein n=1 Tax=Globisporangium ultimum (strain ATCC 200006 / CBS 805.95 / DAOM BR144) TaxID=431595 RepID=K3WY62_GLOUD
MVDARDTLATTVGGFCSVYLGLPFGVVKTRLQTQGTVKSYNGMIHCFKRIAAEEGMASLWKGAVPAFSSSVLACATTSSVSSIAKSAGLALHARKQLGYYDDPMLDEAIVGTATSVFLATAIAPAELIQTKLQFQRGRLGTGEYRGPWDCLQKVLRHEGARGLYRGYSGLLLLYVPANLLFIGSHKAYMSAFAKWQHTEPTKESYPLYTLASLGLAAVTAWNVLYPADVLKAQMQTASDGVLSLRGAAKRVYAQHGIRGFYRGWSVGAMYSLSWTGTFVIGVMTTQHFFGTPEDNK